MKNPKLIFAVLLMLVPFGAFGGNLEDLPPLLEAPPQGSFDILGPVGAGKKTVTEAREQLQREAKKMDAAAVAGVRCESGGMSREGLNFFRKDAYCKGFAIRFKEAPPHAPK